MVKRGSAMLLLSRKEMEMAKNRRQGTEAFSARFLFTLLFEQLSDSVFSENDTS